VTALYDRGVTDGWRRPVLEASERLGVEPALRLVQRALAGSTRRRDEKDTRQMRLLMRLSLAAEANCIDVGANVGDVLREIVAIAPHGRHVAYEPLADLAADLERRFPGVDVRNAAVADAPGEATFYRVRSSHSRSSLSASGLEGEDLQAVQVRIESLDDALGADYAPAFIKIDCEGAEHQVLAGARRILGEHHPLIVFEHGASAAGFATSTADIHELLDGLGYRIFDIDGDGPFTVQEFESVVRKGDIWTFVAHI
jgi:FkbM family methyltransferase